MSGQTKRPTSCHVAGGRRIHHLQSKHSISTVEVSNRDSRDDANTIELFTISSCPHSAAAREDLEWRGVDFVEYDVEADSIALERMLKLTGGARTVPVIAEEGKPVQIGWMGHGCPV